MKKITKYFMFLMMLIPLSLVSCNDDKDSNEPSVAGDIVGTWVQANDYGTAIEITFKSNGTGDVLYKFVSGTTKTEYFEYTTKVDSDNDQYVYISSDDCQLAGEYKVIVTPNTLTLTGYVNGEYGKFVFKRK